MSRNGGNVKVRHRLVIALAGVCLSLYGFGMMKRGLFVYQNHYAMTLYSPGVIAIGVFLCLLAFLPPASWIYELTGKSREVKNRKRSL
jgi:hypothetical protein